MYICTVHCTYGTVDDIKMPSKDLQSDTDIRYNKMNGSIMEF